MQGDASPDEGKTTFSNPGQNINNNNRYLAIKVTITTADIKLYMKVNLNNVYSIIFES